MREGLLWFDNNPQRKPADKVKQAAKHYQTKLRHKPTVCYMNAEEFDSKIDRVNGIQVKPAIYIHPNHYWIGVENDGRRAKAA